MKFSIIIPYYKRLDFLKVVLAGLNRQSYKSFEVIMAEDDRKGLLSDYLSTHQSHYSFPIQHVMQEEDNGFQKNKIMNDALRKANGEWIVFLDGDCIPHRHMMKSFNKRVKANNLYYGRRVMLSDRFSKALIKTLSLKRLNLLNLLFSDSKKIDQGLYLPFSAQFFTKDKNICGYCWSVQKKHLFEVNGFDENYRTAGYGEDVDIEWRLHQIGLRTKSLKHLAIVYHLHHDFVYSKKDDYSEGHAYMLEQQSKHQIVAKNGLKKI